MDEMLAGGIANAGAVRRRDGVVVRPSTPHSPTIHAFLGALRATGFTGAPEPLSLHATEEELRFVEGDVALPPYPTWAQTDDALASVARLLRRFHDASARVSAPFLAGPWSDAFGEPSPGASMICHFDVCLENVVFREGNAIALLDFDFAAPGNLLDDVASFARMCAPVDEIRHEQLGWKATDVGRRLRVILDAYQVKAPRTSRRNRRLGPCARHHHPMADQSGEFGLACERTAYACVISQSAGLAVVETFRESGSQLVRAFPLGL